MSIEPIDPSAQPAAPQGVAPMSPLNRLIAYSAAMKLRSLGFEWNETSETWSQAAPAVGAAAGPVDDIDAIALARYKVVPSHDSMFHRFAVVAGDGKQQLYLGRETECQNMARKFAGAFLDGAFYQSHVAAPTPAAQADSQSAPIDMVLHCPKCGLQHVDAADPPITVLEATLRANPLSMPAPQRWSNPPHRSHLCHGCGHIWRPADAPTNGVAAVKTMGKADSPIAARAPADSVLEDAAPSKCSINRYCHANMCLETDADHETDCPQGHAARKQGGGHV